MKSRVKLRGPLRKFIQLSIYLGVLLVGVNISVYMLDGTAGILVTCFLALYFGVLLYSIYHNKPVIMNEFISFATEYGQIQSKLLRELEVPYALMDDNGKVIWTNDSFEAVLHIGKGYRRGITSLFPEVTKDKLPSEADDAEMELSFENKQFVAKMKKISLHDMAQDSEILYGEDFNGYLVAFYLFDETSLKVALKENDDQSLAVGLMYLDNYEEALESVEEVRRSLLIALIDRKVNKYINSLDGISKKIEKDKYLVILKKKAIVQLQNNRFDLLEEVKTVNIGNEMAVTISIGVGLDAPSYAQNYESARTAIDLALGRGGDQAVVKTPRQVTYYGGKSQQIEKNTRVKARVKAHALKEIITSKDQVIIMGHRMADVDSFGAAVGIYRIAKTLDRKAHIVLNDVSTSVQPLCDMFIGNEEYEDDMIINNRQALEYANNNTVLVVVDVNKPSITECPELLKICRSIVVLDHHRQGSETIDNATLSYVEVYASSTCEMVTEILQYVSNNGIKVRGGEADCLYSGIMIDTNNFMSKTGVRTFEAAAYLRRGGADVTRVRKLFRENVAEYKAKADAVSQAEIYKNDFAISICTSEGVQSPTIVGAQAANELLNIRGVKASFIMTEYRGMVYISARSIDEVNVQVIMERLGGGGHMNIAGCQLEGVSLSNAISRVKFTIDAMLEEGEL